MADADARDVTRVFVAEARKTLETMHEKIERLAGAVRAADAAMAGVTAETVLEHRRIQSYDQTPLGAIFHAVTHFEGHTHQIVYVTRLRLGSAYQFRWVPKGKEQVSGGKK
jgi:hypothetical protein